jgi:hypothetical protein
MNTAQPAQTPAADDLLSLKAAAQLIPGRNGQPVHWRTVWKWTRDGWRGIRLKSKNAGGMVKIPREEINRFIDACTAYRNGELDEREQDRALLQTLTPCEQTEGYRRAKARLAAIHGIS